MIAWSDAGLGRRLVLVLGVTAIHAAIAGLAVSPLFFMPSVATARHVFGGSNGEKALFEDVRAYHEYASRTLNGEIPYRHFDVEYPIGALPLFLLPRLFVSGEITYRWAFAAEMLLFDAALVWLVAKQGERTVGAGRAVFWYSLGLALLGAIPIARFDLAATFLAFAAMMALNSKRSGLGGVLAGIGGLVKLFPVVVAAPNSVAWPLRKVGLAIPTRELSPSQTTDGSASPALPGRSITALLVTFSIGASIWFLIGGPGVMRSIRYHGERGLEIESLYAGGLIVMAKILRWPLAHQFNHSSVELIAPYAAIAAKLAPILQLIAIAWVLRPAFKAAPSSPSPVPLVVPDQCSSAIIQGYWSGTTSDTREITRAAACILAFALFGKVLSPQYLLWMLPFVAALEGRTGRIGRPLLMLACGLTTLLYFWAGVGLLQFHPLAVAILNIRNLLLLALFVILTRRA